ncbi:MAG: acyl-ACP--UDP-N-acetylglucosamine O-acyltransferase [Planctomycetes bacterium]|nr:acyl-ACP--UDP-N-acetylglucosamine O-acyltransferase [Planctomycetota bacterium]
MPVHPTAVLDSSAEIGSDVDIGPGAVIGAGVTLGDRCRVGPHACLAGPLVVGEGCVFGPSVAIGHDPQVKGRSGPFGRTRIGSGNVFREFTSVHRSMFEDRETVVGDDGYFMACSHVAHDCVVGDHVVLCNGAMLAGHVTVGSRAFLSGAVGVHQFCRIGELAMIGGGAVLTRDAPPYGLVVDSRPSRLEGINTVGLRRAGVSSEVRQALRHAYQILFRTNAPLEERFAQVPPDSEEVRCLIRFLRESKRGVVGFGATPRAPSARAT